MAQFGSAPDWGSGGRGFKSRPPDRKAPGCEPRGLNCRYGASSWQNGYVITDDERAQRLANLNELIDLIRPAVQSDGGDLVLVSADVESGAIEVQLQGSCSSCAISSTTLQAGVERILKDRLDWVSEVHGGVDESMDLEESAALGRGGYVPKY